MLLTNATTIIIIFTDYISLYMSYTWQGKEAKHALFKELFLPTATADEATAAVSLVSYKGCPSFKESLFIGSTDVTHHVLILSKNEFL